MRWHIRKLAEHMGSVPPVLFPFIHLFKMGEKVGTRFPRKADTARVIIQENNDIGAVATDLQWE